MSMVTEEGQWKDLTFQACDVTRPLASVMKICEAGHSVCFNPTWDSQGGFTISHLTKEKTWIKTQDGVYVLDAWVAPTHEQSRPGFPGQGR